MPAPKQSFIAVRKTPRPVPQDMLKEIGRSTRVDVESGGVERSVSRKPANVPKQADYRTQDKEYDEARSLLESDFSHLTHSNAKANYVLSRAEILDIADKAFEFCKSSTGVELYPYQAEFGLRIVQSLLLEDSDTISALFSRQSGKTELVAVVVSGLMVLLPRLATIPELARDSRIAKFKDGLWVGIFAPVYEQAAILHSRAAARMTSKAMKETMRDPEIALDPEEGKAALRMAHGSFLDCMSAAPGTNIEGKTYHLIITEESQDISDLKFKKSIRPMGAATGATSVAIGTCGTHKGTFYQITEANKLRDVQKRGTRGELPCHFQYDFKVALKYNYRYRQYIDKEMQLIGFDSDEFRMAYRLQWMTERGHFLSADILERCAIKQRDTLKKKVGRDEVRFTRPDYPTSSDLATEQQIAAIDIGKDNDSTVITVARVFWAAPVTVTDTLYPQRFYVHVQNWLEIQGSDHEAQYPVIKEFLGHYNISKILVDSTGRGDPVRSRLEADYLDKGVEVLGFVFTLQAKHNGYTALYQEMFAGRVTYPAGAAAQKMMKYKRFYGQLSNLEKNYKGMMMSPSAPKKARKGKDGRSVTSDETSHDDYADSLMMVVWLANCMDVTVETESSSVLHQYDTQGFIRRRSQGLSISDRNPLSRRRLS